MTEGVAGLVLAGGRGRRLGGRDKALIDLAGIPLLGRVIARLGPQCSALVISANGDPARFSAWRAPVVADCLPGRLGPLSGVLTGLDWMAAHRPDLNIMVSVSVDTPFLPQDLVARLVDGRAAAEAEVACAVSAGQRHPVVALWPVGLRAPLREALAGTAGRSVGGFLNTRILAEVVWPSEPLDPFFNINDPDDLEAASRLLGGPSAE